MSGRDHFRHGVARFFALSALALPVMAQTSRPTNVSQRMACEEFAFSVYAVTYDRAPKP